MIWIHRTKNSSDLSLAVTIGNQKNLKKTVNINYSWIGKYPSRKDPSWGWPWRPWTLISETENKKPLNSNHFTQGSIPKKHLFFPSITKLRFQTYVFLCSLLLKGEISSLNTYLLFNWVIAQLPPDFLILAGLLKNSALRIQTHPDQVGLIISCRDIPDR